jgi:hypothetical protein
MARIARRLPKTAHGKISDTGILGIGNAGTKLDGTIEPV